MTDWGVEMYGADDEMSWPQMIAYILGLVIFILAIAIFCVRSDEKSFNKKWNNGICTECGGQYEYEQAIGHQHSTHYIYKCNICDHRVELERLP